MNSSSAHVRARPRPGSSAFWRAEEGIALVAAVIVTMTMLGLGLAVAAFADTQQQTAVVEQSSEAAYSVAEAALNAQVYQLSLTWPTATSPDPGACAPVNGLTASGCPTPAPLGTGYPTAPSTACSGGVPVDPWGAPAGTQWATYVRDNGGGTNQLFQSQVDRLQPPYDANGDGNVWVRAVGVANCRLVAVTTLVSLQQVPLTFPQDAVNANGFEVSNKGTKTIVDSQGNAPQAGQISVRCNGLAGPPGPGTRCTDYAKPVEVQPANYASPPAPPGTLNATQLASLKAQAQANGTYFPAGSCPSSVTALSGAPAYVEGPCALNFTGTGTANSQSSPGYLILVNGTLELSGNSTYYGVVYAVNAQGCGATGVSCAGAGSDAVYIHGNAQVVGAIDVDGNGTVGFGESKENLVYDNSAFKLMKTSGGAAATPNTFRVLPAGQ